MHCSRTKRTMRKCFAVMMIFLTFWFISIWNSSCCGYPEIQKTREHMHTPNNTIFELVNIHKATTEYKTSESDIPVSGRIINKFVIQSTISVVSEVKLGNFIESANRLAYTAFAEGADYFILICNNSINITRDIARHFVQNLMAHTAPNIGVVAAVGNARKETYCIVVHRSHLEIFNHLFPKMLRYENAVQWIKDIYRPYHITILNIRVLTTKYVRSVTYEHGPNEENHSLKIARSKIRDHIVSNINLMIVSYSLYGSESRYTDGVLANAELLKIVYRRWKMWVYHDNTVPAYVLSGMCGMEHVTCINMENTKFINKMSWRFLIASVDFICRFVVRDIDSRLSARDFAAVNEWIESGKSFHIMRDHPSHSKYPINGGLWGGIRGVIPDIEDLLHSKISKNYYMHDMNFLNSVVWPIAKYDVYQHDSFSCQKYGGHPFPIERIGLEHVGGVYINGKLRRTDTDILKKTKTPKKCIRSKKD